MPIIKTVQDLDFQLADLPPLAPFAAVFMADPRDFDVEYAINPHMLDANGELQKVDRARAREQWEALRQALETCGMQVNVEDALDGHPDFVFCANPGLPIPADAAGGQARWIPSRMASGKRAGEVQRWAEVFEARGWSIEPLEGDAELFEGTGDGLWHPRRRLLWGGIGSRTSSAAWEELANRYDLPIVTLELQDPDLYHLDTCLALLDERTCLWVPEAFDALGQALIRKLFSGNIEISMEDAKQHFACNAFAPDTGSETPLVLMQAGAQTARAALEQRGFRVQELETGEYLKSGGSVFCMKLALPV
ncbi:MAG: N-dimethylarginine dimethylaminohydrolase [Planctomycetota bacterium]|jgi:N-dimethylarginine dimethylaminohydrolase